MSNQFLTSERLDALIDGELSPSDIRHAEAEIQRVPQLQEALRMRKNEQALIRHALRSEIERVYEEDAIDARMDAMMERLMAKIDEPALALEEPPVALLVAPTKIRPSSAPALRPTEAGQPWWKALFGWFQAHPSMSVALAGATVVLVIFAVPRLDPGPTANDCVVDNVVSRKKDTVAVLQSNNQAGQPMTVIIVENPPPSPAEIEAGSPTPKPSKKAAPKKAKKEPKAVGTTPTVPPKAPQPRKD